VETVHEQKVDKVLPPLSVDVEISLARQWRKVDLLNGFQVVTHFVSSSV
jgi:hypothetical protein